MIFLNIDRSWNIIAHRPVLTNKGENNFTSLKGRGICILHTLSTPLKAISGLGLLVLVAADTALTVFSVLTLNGSPKNLKQASCNVIDVAVGIPLLPIALIANIIRGLAGIIHPAAMIRASNPTDDAYQVNHNILWGTIVNYN